MRFEANARRSSREHSVPSQTQLKEHFQPKSRWVLSVVVMVCSQSTWLILVQSRYGTKGIYFQLRIYSAGNCVLSTLRIFQTAASLMIHIKMSCWMRNSIVIGIQSRLSAIEPCWKLTRSRNINWFVFENCRWCDTIQINSSINETRRECYKTTVSI